MKIRKKTKLLWKDSFLCTFFGFAIIALLSLLVINLSFFNPLKKVIRDFSFLDVYYAENLDPSDKANTNIVLINVEQRDRFELAMLLQKVNQSNPKVVGVDMIFRDLKESYSDSLLNSALNHSNVVLGYVQETSETINNHPYFNSGQPEGFVNLNFDNSTSVIRNFTGLRDEGGVPNYSFSAQIVRNLLTSEEWSKRKYSRLLAGDTPLRYSGNLDAFLHFGYEEFMEQEDLSVLKDKIVLLGYLGTPTGNPFDVEDKHFTPLNEVTAGKSIPDMYGVVVHANIIAMLLEGNIAYRMSNFWLGILSFLLSFIMIMYFIWLGEKDKISFRTIKKIVQFVFTIALTGITLFLFKKGYIVNAVPLIGIPLLCSGYIKYYKHLVRYIQTKRKWKSYMN